MFTIQTEEGRRTAVWAETADVAEWSNMDVFAKVEYLREHLPHVFRCGVFSGAWSAKPEVRLTNAWSEIATKCLTPTSWQVGIDDAETIKKLVNTFEGVPREIFDSTEKALYVQKLNGIEGGLLFKDLGVDETLEKWRRLITWVVKHYPEFPDSFRWDETLPKNAVAFAARVILGGVKPSEIGKDLFKNRRNMISFNENGIMMLSDEAINDGWTVEWSFKENPDHSAGEISPMDCFGMSGAISLTIREAFSKAIGGDKAEEKKFRKTLSVPIVPEQWEVDAGVVIGLVQQKKRKGGFFK